MTLVIMSIQRGVIPVSGNTALTRYGITVAVLASVAVLTELGQQLTHRESSVADVVRDLAGILIGLGCYAYTDPDFTVLSKQKYHALRSSTFIFSGSLVVASLFPLLHLAVAYVQRDDAFPVIIDFQAGWISPFLRLDQAMLTLAAAPDTLASNSGHTGQQQVHQLTLDPGKYPGISIIEPYPDWSEYKTLVLDLYSMQSHSMTLVLRIHDSHHNQEHSDRFNQALTVKPGNNRFRIPLTGVEHAPAGRQMDMRHVENIMLFAADIDAAVNFYPGTLKLE
jgi:hypothetical protein